jgi:glutamine synthetase type III
MKGLGLLGEDSTEFITAKTLSRLCRETDARINTLRSHIDESHMLTCTLNGAEFARDNIIPAMRDLRKIADTLEAALPKRCIPYPTYEQLLFNE